MANKICVRSLADQVADRLRAELMAGQEPPGTPVREEELAERFGVSRHPIRKALQRLTLEGLLTARPNCGVVVAASMSEHVPGLLTPLRVQLELYALGLAFPRLDSGQRREWDRIVRQMQAACTEGDSHAVLEADVAFHLQLLLAAGLESMVSLWHSIYGRMRDHHRKSNEMVADARVIAFVHQRLVTHLFSGDFDRAVQSWQSHLENGEFNKRGHRDWERQNQRDSATKEGR